MWESRPSVQPSAPEYKDATTEPAPPAAAPTVAAPELVEITVPPDAVLGLQIERTITSELARVEDKVDARVTRDVRVDGRVAIPAGSTVRGSVTEVDRGGRVKGKARLAIRFHTVMLADGTQVGLKTDPVIREGTSPNGESAAKVGGAAIGGAILGAILGGGKGAAIGAGAGAAGGTTAVMASERNPAILPAGTTVTVRMQAPVTVTVQKE
jgi:type IV secretory pathway VirB10-like protein